LGFGDCKYLKEGQGSFQNFYSFEVVLLTIGDCSNVVGDGIALF